MVYDTIIIGGGPSGLTAAIYLGRYHRKTLLVASDIGGQTAIAGTLENFPGFLDINGFELISKMHEQAKKLETVEIKVGERVNRIFKAGGLLTIETEGNSYQAKTILIAAGKRHRELGLENEKNLIGKGLSYCATCDGPFAKGKDIVVIGGGYAATEAALILKRVASSVTIINIGKELFGEKLTIKKIVEDKSIKVINSAKTTAIKQRKDSLIEKIEYCDEESGQTKTINARMVFVEIGQIPNTENFKETVDLNDKGEIIINNRNRTDKDGIYAAGDITDIRAKQTVIACGEGAKAAIAINDFLENKS